MACYGNANIEGKLLSRLILFQISLTVINEGSGCLQKHQAILFCPLVKQHPEVKTVLSHLERGMGQDSTGQGVEEKRKQQLFG